MTNNTRGIINDMPLNFFSDPEEAVELTELWLSLNQSSDDDNYAFFNFYCYLWRYLIFTHNPEEKPNCGLNALKKAILDSHYKKDDKRKNELYTYLENDYEKHIHDIAERVNKEYFDYLKKIPQHIALTFQYETGQKMSTRLGFYSRFNRLVWMLEMIKLRKYYISYMKSIVAENKRAKRQFILGIILAIVGTMATFVFGIIPFIAG